MTFIRFDRFAVCIALALATDAIAETIPLINANLASEYIVTGMPMTKSPNCPLIGSINFEPGGTLQGTFITDMARSKYVPFSGSYTLTNGKDIKFKSDSGLVPLSNLDGTIARAVITNKKRPPVERFIITTASVKCPNELYKLTLTELEEE